MIRLIKPYIDYSEVEAAYKEVFASGIFTKGHWVNDFEVAIKNYTGAKYSYFTTSATTALTMALKVIDIKPGDEVIISDFSFPATVNVVEDLYATPVFCDVDLSTYNMNAQILEEKITKKTRAVVFVDALGNPSGLHKIKEICEKHKVPLVEDAACALGSSENNKRCGNIADLTCFSFHPRKLLTTGEGGCIQTNNSDYSDILQVKLAHGATVNNGVFDFIAYGYNYRLSELQAIMGYKQILKLDNVIAKRQQLKNMYEELLVPYGLIPQKVMKNVKHNIQSVVFYVPKHIDRNQLISYLRLNNIETTIGTYCLSGCTYYLKKYNQLQRNSNDLFLHTITLPCHDEVDCEYVCEKIISFIKGK